jgi:hypothetical protein
MPFPPLSFVSAAPPTGAQLVLPRAAILVPILGMKHAGPVALDRVEPLIQEIRKREGLKEVSRGRFYRGSRAFLHFHDHGEDGMYADVRLGDDFERLRVTTAAERTKLLRLMDKALSDGRARRPR